MHPCVPEHYRLSSLDLGVKIPFFIGPTDVKVRF
jgi:hypothetical protein